MQWTKADGDVLRLAREGRGWSRAHLARESSVSESTIVDLENGVRRDGEPVNPRAATLRALERALADERVGRVVMAVIGAEEPRRRSLSYTGRPLSEEEEADVLRYIEFVQRRDG